MASHSIDFFRRINAIREGGDPGQGICDGPCSHVWPILVGIGCVELVQQETVVFFFAAM